MNHLFSTRIINMKIKEIQSKSSKNMNTPVLEIIRLSCIKNKLIEVTEGRVNIIIINKCGSYQDVCFAI